MSEDIKKEIQTEEENKENIDSIEEDNTDQVLSATAYIETATSALIKHLQERIAKLEAALKNKEEKKEEDEDKNEDEEDKKEDEVGLTYLSELAPQFIEKLSNGYVKVPIAIKGKFKHGKYNNISFDDKDYEDIKRNFKEGVLGFSSYLTYGHSIENGLKSSDEFVERSRAIDAERKKGNLVDLTTEAVQDKEVLFGLYQSPEETYDLVKKGEYEYSSGEFIRNYQDKVTGKNLGTVLVRTALTNSPFLPFNEVKVEALSNNSNLDVNKEETETSLQNVTNFVIKLSAEPIKNDTNLNKINMSESNAINEAVQSALEMQQPSTNTEAVKEEPKAEDFKVESTKEKVEAVNPANQFDVNKLIEQVSSVYKEQLKTLQAQSAQVIETLRGEINSLKEDINKQQQVSQAFSNSLSQQQKQYRNNELVTKGVSPALIQKFSQIESSLELNGNSTSVIKLSNSNNEVVEKSLVSAIEELLVEAVHNEPVVVEQYGQSMSITHANDFVSSLQGLINSNNEKNVKLMSVK